MEEKKRIHLLAQILSAVVPHTSFFGSFCLYGTTKYGEMGLWVETFKKRNIPRDSLLCILTFLQVKQTDGDKLEKKNNNKK